MKVDLKSWKFWVVVLVLAIVVSFSFYSLSKESISCSPKKPCYCQKQVFENPNLDWIVISAQFTDCGDLPKECDKRKCYMTYSYRDHKNVIVEGDCDEKKPDSSMPLGLTPSRT